MGLPNTDVDEIIKNADYMGNNKINYTEFLAATLSYQNFLTAERLQNLFNVFDTDGSGYITSDNLKEAFSRLGRNKISSQ